MLLQNISLSLNDMTLQPTIPRSSQSLLWKLQIQQEWVWTCY
jgi:hypothetical protein